MINAIFSGRAPVFSYGKEWVLKDKSPQEQGTLLSISATEYDAMKVVLYERPEYAENIPEVPGAVEGTKALQAAGHEVTIVTSRGPGIPQKVVEAWLRTHDLEVPVMFGVRDKTSVLSEFDIFVDDSARHLAFGDASLETLRFLFIHFYNVQHMAAHQNVGFLGRWEDLLEEMERLGR